MVVLSDADFEKKVVKDKGNWVVMVSPPCWDALRTLAAPALQEKEGKIVCSSKPRDAAGSHLSSNCDFC